MAIAQERFAGNFARNQAAPSGLFKLSSGITAEGFKRFKAEVENLYKGWRNAGRFGVPPQLVGVQDKMTLNNAEIGGNNSSAVDEEPAKASQEQQLDHPAAARGVK